MDVAGGLGRHALWLAARKWKMSVVDVSAVAIEQLRQEARDLGLELDLFALDAAKYDFQRSQYDTIVLFYHLDRGLFPRIVSALNSGGLFICKMAIRWNGSATIPGAATSPLQRDELRSLVPGLHVVEYQERPVRGRGVAEFIGSKP